LSGGGRKSVEKEEVGVEKEEVEVERRRSRSREKRRRNLVSNRWFATPFREGKKMLYCSRQSREADGRTSPGRCERATRYSEREKRAEKGKERSKKDSDANFVFDRATRTKVREAKPSRQSLPSCLFKRSNPKIEVDFLLTLFFPFPPP